MTAAAATTMSLQKSDTFMESKMNIEARKISFAAAAAAIALSSAAAFAADAPAGRIGADSTVHCYDVNSCKGQADCATAENACKGQNECKGHGFKAMAAGKCLSKGGTIGDLG